MFANAEFLRNVRSQLSPAKMAVSAISVGLLTLVAAAGLNHLTMPAGGPSGWGFGLLHLLFWLQALVLAGGGGIACVNAIYREKDQNTFDFQRVTRLSPLELTLGKLFGAPVFTYFLCLCTVPAVIFAAVRGRQSFTIVIAAYVVLLVGAISFHAFALLISLLTVRGSHTAAIIFVLVVLGVVSSVPTGISYFFRLGSLSPFYAAQVAIQRDWSPPTSPSTLWQESYMPVTSVADVFFGHPVRHLIVMLVVVAALGAWCLLALTRNVKRDPTQYELYSPLQSLGIVAFINLVLLGFVNWQVSLIDVQATLLTLNGVILGSIGLAQLRNRDRTRRLLRARKSASPSWVDLAWPAPFLFVAAAGASLLVSVAANVAHDTPTEWSTAFNIFRSLFFAAWILRDTQFLQCMILRRGKRPLAMGILYLMVFYACAWILFSSFGVLRNPDLTAFTAFVLPTPIYYLDHAAWSIRPAIWAAAFVAQWAMIALCILVQRGTILELGRPATVEPIPVPAD